MSVLVNACEHEISKAHMAKCRHGLNAKECKICSRVSKRRWTVKSDEAWDAKHGVKEGSATDTKLDRKRGVLGKEESEGIKHVSKAFTPKQRGAAGADAAAAGGGVAVAGAGRASVKNYEARLSETARDEHVAGARREARRGGNLTAARKQLGFAADSHAAAQAAHRSSYRARKVARGGAALYAAGVATTVGSAVVADRSRRRAAVGKAADERTARQRSGHPRFKALNNSRAGEVIKAYTPGTITYHQAAARDEGRKKRSSESVARAGAATAVGAAYTHAHAGDVASKLKIAPGQVKTGSKVAAVAGAAAAGAGVAGAVVHGVRRNRHFKAAQAGRLQREPEIAKNAFGISKASLGALDDLALAPAKVSSVKASVTGSSPKAATVPPQKRKILAPIEATASASTPGAPPLPGQSTLQKSAFGPTL